MRNDHERLHDILEAIIRIERYVEQGKEAFGQDELIQVWIAHHLQIIGEAARATSSEFKMQHSHLPWSQTIGLHNVLVHEYFQVNVEIVWAIVERDLPDLKQKVEAILQELSQEL
ncbi:HepT-like ribonuclease domain-containing protein [Phormidesmis priestleyi]